MRFNVSYGLHWVSSRVDIPVSLLVRSPVPGRMNEQKVLKVVNSLFPGRGEEGVKVVKSLLPGW